MAERDAVEWLRMMATYSGLTDSEPHFARIADEMEALRAEVAAFQPTPPLRPAAATA